MSGIYKRSGFLFGEHTVGDDESHLCFQTNLTNSLPWKANHDLKDQVGSASIHCDTAK